MMRKLLVMIVVLAFCVSCTSAFADEGAEFAPPERLCGVLTADDGTQYTLIGKRVSTKTCLDGDGDDLLATYEYAVPNVAAAHSYESTKGPETDSGMASKVYMTLHYNMKDELSPQYLLTAVSGYWVITDTKASVESAHVYYGCSCAGITQTGTEAVSNYFKVYTGFEDYIYEGSAGVMGVQLTINYLMGTARRWSTTFTYNLFNTSYV